MSLPLSTLIKLLRGWKDKSLEYKRAKEVYDAAMDHKEGTATIFNARDEYLAMSKAREVAQRAENIFDNAVEIIKEELSVVDRRDACPTCKAGKSDRYTYHIDYY